MKNRGLYIHIPFCEQKCFYCSFVIAVGQEHRMEEYVECVCAEMPAYRGMDIQTVYVGGGTPGFLKPEQLKKVFDGIHRHFSVHPRAEVTLEANPQDLDSTKANIIFDLGVNRLSIGAQSFHDDKLKYLGRKHTAQNVVEAFDQARKAGIKNINLDLMYGFPDQTMDELEKDVATITSLGAEHISLYTLTIENNSRFFTKNLQLPDSEIQVEQYAFVKEFMEKKGYGQYEVSNFSRKGFASRHNLNYWRGGEYIGLGIAAHSYIDGKRGWNISRLPEYMKRLKDGQSPQEESRHLSVTEQFMDAFLFGLRMNEGVDVEKLEKRFNVQLDDARKSVLHQMSEHHLIVKNESLWKVTDRGRLVLDEICARLV